LSVLRPFVVAAALVAIVAGAVLASSGARGLGAYLLLSGAIVFVGTVFERWRYRSGRTPDGEHWERTGERFEDPSTHETVEVLFNPRSGARRYVPAGPSSQPDRTA
jgi:hypothetical protein